MLTVTFCPVSVVETMTALNESEAKVPSKCALECWHCRTNFTLLPVSVGSVTLQLGSFWRSSDSFLLSRARSASLMHVWCVLGCWTRDR
jgi:hypothetical protein